MSASVEPSLVDAALPDGGGALGVFGAIVMTVLIVVAAVWVDRRVEGWLARWSGSPRRALRQLVRRAVLVRIALWLAAVVLTLGLAAWLSPLVAWALVPTTALALALAVAGPLREALLGIGQALGRRIGAGDYVAIGALEGRVLRVGIQTLVLEMLDGTVVDVPVSRLAEEGVRRLTVQARGGHPVHLELPIVAGVALEALLEEARLAAALAPHANLVLEPAVTLGDGEHPTIVVRGYALDPFAAPAFRSAPRSATPSEPPGDCGEMASRFTPRV